ncbi:hypothetical protein RRG08_060658 [Elysia crispata]|uniref:Fibronectin type-III domain-containing protein n=1 Tax=Elysia crispata TaxID=231223 RepID=A0AAE1ASH0_9GAST|nr:hypothetical protein RRG08_060658 [Elysia crispata]
MSSVLNNAAVAAVTRGQPSSYYLRDNRPNPVLQALDQELKLFVGYMKKRAAPGYTKPADESHARPADTLFILWNKYEPRLPPQYYQEKLLEIGDFLVTTKEYKLALWQCYERYLLTFGDVNVEEISDVDTFRETFFPEGFDAENAGLTFRALMGKSISMYQVVKLSDPKLQNKQSIEKCVQILSFLRLVTQVVLPKETLCWLVYNGTVHIYSMSRHLMSLGHSARVLEYLLWASMCMETSVPLLGVRYLKWRATLYTAVCQCYYDCKAGDQAEKFARRGLTKIRELSHLEGMSSNKDTASTEVSFRTATVRMALMVFKRSVFETRRKPKGLLRPKTRANLKDALNLPWPRTPTEKLLADMFDGGSAQFLAILESLSDSNRRILQTSPPAPDNEPEILDVFCELLMAAQEILAGGAGNRVTGANKAQMALGAPPLTSVIPQGSLMAMAARGEEGIPLDAVIQLLKLAYNYEHWDVFENLMEPVLGMIKEYGEERYRWDIKALELLKAMGKMGSGRRVKKQQAVQEEEDPEKPAPQAASAAPSASLKSALAGDDLINVADVLMSIVAGPYKPDQIEIDIVVDATMFLWTKCKLVFQKYQTGSVDNPRFLQKMDNPTKWMHLLDTVHQALGWCGLSSVDPALTAEVVLRLAMVYESSAQLDSADGKGLETFLTQDFITPRSLGPTPGDTKSALKESKTTLTDYGTGTPGGESSAIPQQTTNSPSRASQLSLGAQMSARAQLIQARDILELGLKNVSFARKAVALNDGKNIADVTWVKELNPEIFASELTKEMTEGTVGGDDTGATNPDMLVPASMQGSATAVWNMIKDLHLELILMYHRVCLKLASLGPPQDLWKNAKGSTRQSRVQKEGADQDTPQVEDFDKLIARCNKNYLSKALLFTQRAVMLGTDGAPSAEQRSLLEEALTFVQRVQTEEKRIHQENTGVEEKAVAPSKTPPPPVLVCRTDTAMVFRPAPFVPSSGEKVAWYRIFGRSASGANVKARLSDYYFPGTGEEVPSFRCEMTVTGLQPDERYVFAVAAYTTEGKLIGDGVGETSKPVLASHCLPVLMTWAFISQMAYQVGCYDIADQACNVLWDHFVVRPQVPASSTYITEAKKDFKLTLLRLNQRAVCLSSPVLLRQFLTSIMISVDTAVREGRLFCDLVCDRGAPYSRQIARLHQCERMLVALELAGWLNEANLALQAAVQIYGLLAPVLYFKIPSLAVVQILQRVHAVLQEIPLGLIQKRQGFITDSLNHMIACITFHMAKALRTWGQKTLANTIIEAGRRLLATEADTKAVEDKTDAGEDASVAEDAAGKGKKKAQGLPPVARKVASKDELDGPVNEELKALEAHMLSVTKAASAEHELSGSEDPSILHSYISYLPSFIAFKEVIKFKRRQRYLEFLVHVSQKGLTEGMADQVVLWCEDGIQWLTKRNESIIGTRAFLNKQPGAVTVSGDDPRKFAAAMVEYSKDKDTPREARVPGRKESVTGKVAGAKGAAGRKKTKYKPLGVTESMSDTSRQLQEERELKALDILSLYFVDMVRLKGRRLRMRKITLDEAPWRSQLNIIHGLSHFSTFLEKLEKREKMLGSMGTSMNRTNFMDQEWFTFETAGVMIVGWEGGPGPTSQADYLALAGPGIDTARGVRALDTATKAMSQVTGDRPRTTGIEFAAAAATGAPPPPLYTIPPEVEDTPRTYRSSKTVESTEQSTKVQEDSSPLTTAATIEALEKTFACLTRAVTLAHRGQHWTLLQNAGRALWNCAHTALLRAFTADQSGSDPGLLTTDMLRSLVWRPFYMASDCVLDMMATLQESLEKQASRAKSRGKNLGEYFESWVGDVRSERGGASLKFDSLLDDTTVTDARWTRRLILRTLELLYLEGKWEKLVDLALRYSALTNNRYAEQVIPLLVQAQHFLERRVKQSGGPAPPQPHFQLLQRQLGHVVRAKDYLRAQLLLEVDKEGLAKTIQPGAQIDPLGHNTYSEQDAFRLSCVPLDTDTSLQSLRETLDQAHYTARALQHSRKLLSLYLSGQQNINESIPGREVTHVDFQLAAGHPQSTMPPNKMTSDFLSISDVQVTPIPRSQLGTVISSYEKTIEILFAKNQRGLSAQAMHELGNIYFHSKNPRAAFKWWCHSLDIILGMQDAVRTWRESLTTSKPGAGVAAEDISTVLLDRCGLWGCIMAGVLASNIAQYILTSDIGLRIECCFLSGYLFKALLRSSLPHPTADRDYALYDVGEGCEVTNLVPGVDFMSDRFRCDGRQLVAALRWVTEELSRAHHNLFILPLLTLSQYFTTFVCRDVQRAVDCRVLKVRVLTDLGLYSQAMVELGRLLNGERLPHTGDSNFRQMEGRSNSRGSGLSAAKPIMEPQNLKILETLLDKRLSSSLGTLFGPHMTCHLNLVQAHLFVSLAATIPVLPRVEEHLSPDPTFPASHPEESTISRAGLGGKGPALSTIVSSGAKATTDGPPSGTKPNPSVDPSAPAPARFSDGQRVLTLEEIKGTLLSVADKMVTTMSDVIVDNVKNDKKGVESLSAAELELVVQCRLEQGRIAQQKQHAPMAARTVLDALKMLQNAQIFKHHKPQPPPPRPSSMKGGHSAGGRKPVDVRLAEPENAQFQYQNFQARSRLDARLWLQCRLELVQALMMEVRGMGEVKGAASKVVSDLADCRQYCAEGLGEAEVCGDAEGQAHFFLMGAQLNVIEGKSLEHTVSLLEDAIRLLRSVPRRSVPGDQLLAACITFKADLEAAATRPDVNSDQVTHNSLASYLEAQKIILDQMEQLGEKIEHYYSDGRLDHLSSPCSPMQNVYLPHVQRLAQLKLRIGHAKARNAAKQINAGALSDEPAMMWVDCLGVLTTALEISQVSACREAALEAEILLLMGKVQKMLVYLGKYQARSAANTLLEAIKISYINDHDLGLIRQAYLEIALIYLYSSGMVTIKDGSFLESLAGDSGDETSSVVSSRSTERRYKRSKSNLKKDKSRPEREETDQEKERRAAWTAIRCGAAVANAQRHRQLLVGDPGVSNQRVGEAGGSGGTSDVPDFVSLDLLSGYVLGEKKRVYKNEIEEELASMTEAQEPRPPETYDDKVNKARQAAHDLSWIHLLGYQSILQRLVSTSTLSLPAGPPSNGNAGRDGDEGQEREDGGNELDLGFISHAQFDTGANYDVVRYMMMSGPWVIRLRQLHMYLTNQLKAYSGSCCAPYPPAALNIQGQMGQQPTELNITIKSYASNLSLNSDLEGESISDEQNTPPRAPLPPGSNVDTIKLIPPTNVTSSGLSPASTAQADSEASIQWYQPGLGESDPARPQAISADRRILMLYALTRGRGGGKLVPGFIWVSQHRLNDLHDRLALLSQRAEISLVEKVKKEATPPSPTPSKAKKTQRIKALSPKVQRDEQLESLLKQCLDDAVVLTSSVLEQGPATQVSEIPFEVSKVNIKSLENLFDPSLGMTLKGSDLLPWVLKLFP